MPETSGEHHKATRESFPVDLQKAEKQLRAERDKLLSELALDTSLPDELANGWQDRDSASESGIRDVEFEHRGAVRQRILRIERALEQIKLGTYGRCVVCGQAVDPRRMTEEPDVSTCFVCQRAVEGEGARRTM